MHFISQIGEHDCGFACLAMLLANYHHDKNYLFLKHEDRQYSFKELIDEAKKYNTELKGVKISDPFELTNNEVYPIIVVIKLDDGALHSVLLLKANTKKVVYYDPAYGKVVESFIDFTSKWTKNALIVTKYQKTTCDTKPESFIAKRDKITLPIFQLLSGVSLLIATFFMDREVAMYLPIIFFVLFFVFELLFRDNLIKAMRRMDTIIEDHDVDIPKEKYHDLFVATEKYRAKALTRVPEIINASLISAFLVFILLINSRMNAVYVILVIFLAVIECLVFNPFINQKALEVDKQERTLYRVDSISEYHILARSTRESAYKIGQYRTVYTYVSIGVLLFTSILLMAISNVVSLTYIVFYLCVCLFLRMNIIKVFSFEEISTYRDNEHVKIICYLK